jgi:uncharacterized repeat protein (TIGR03803 family)
VRPAYKVLYSFAGGPGDGANPYASLINVKGTLYGTTELGGANNSYGTVFSITTSGSETVLYSFKGGYGDGEIPQAGLNNVAGTLYGTTEGGGSLCNRGGCGTVFSITRSGTETVLHNFGPYGYGDGANPYAGLLNVKGTLYGTTWDGGAGGGTVFSITPSGTETVLHSFKGGSGDGAGPWANLINVKGTLYGTTEQGGANSLGTLFSITPSGSETVLHSFKGGSGDGKYPYASLINVKGTLYGTTVKGGAYCRPSSGCGTVFSITPSGTETVLQSFGGTGDGENPFAELINVKGTLYGTTALGGTNGDGTVFWLSP